jgi:hypothetical protein
MKVISERAWMTVDDDEGGLREGGKEKKAAVGFCASRKQQSGCESTQTVNLYLPRYLGTSQIITHR